MEDNKQESEIQHCDICKKTSKWKFEVETEDLIVELFQKELVTL